MLRRSLALAAATLLATSCTRDAPPAPAAPVAPVPAPAPARPRAPGRPPAGVAARTADPTCADPGAGPDVDGRELQGFVKRRTRAVRQCYDQALKRNPELRGRFKVRFTIGTCGEVQDLAFASGEPPRELAACVTASIRSWKLPFRPAEPVEVEYPFNFTAN